MEYPFHLTGKTARHIIKRLQLDPKYIQHFTIQQLNTGDFDVQTIEVDGEFVVVTFREGTQIRRARWFFDTVDKPSKSTTNETTTFERSKRSHSEEPANKPCAKRLKTRQETNANYIDRLVVPGEQLPDMPDSLKLKETIPTSSPLLSPATPVSKAAVDLSGSSSREAATAGLSNSVVVLDDDVDEYLRVHLVSDECEPEPEEVLSARRIPNSKPGNKLGKVFSEGVSGATLNSAEVEIITSATSDEHKQKDSEEAENSPKKEPYTWTFAERYRKGSRLQPPLPKTPDTSAVPSGESAQMIQPRRKPVGGVRPQNTLTKDVHNKNNPPYKSPVQRSNLEQNAFNFHTDDRHARNRPDQAGSKRQRLNNGSSNYQGSSRSPIDVDHSQKGVPQSIRSQNLSTTSRQASQKDGGVYEFNHVENTVKSGGRPRVRKSTSSDSRVNGMGEHKKLGPKVLQANYFKHGDIVNVGEIPDDPILDLEMTRPIPPAKRNTFPSVEILVGSPAKTFVSGHQGNASTPPKTTVKRKSTRNSSVTEIDAISPYFATVESRNQASNPSRPRSAQTSGTNRDGLRSTNQLDKASMAHSHRFNGHLDHESSPDELAGQPPNSSDRSNQRVAKVILDKFSKSKKLQQKPTAGSAHHSSVAISDSEDEDRLNMNDLKQTKFHSSKKSKVIEATPDDLFYLHQVFSLNHKWLDSSQRRKWAIRQNPRTDTLMVEDDTGVPCRDLILAPNSITRVLYNKESSKLILQKSSDKTARREHQIMFEMESSLQIEMFVTNMTAYRSPIKLLEKPSDHLDKIFGKTLKDLDHGKTVARLHDDDELELMTKKSEVRNAKYQTSIQEHKRETGGRTLKDGMTTASADSHSRKADTSSSHDDNIGDDHTNRRSRHSGLAPDVFYGKPNEPLVDPLNTLTTRSSSRLQAREQNSSPRPQRFPTPIPRWTETEPGWVRKYRWKKSVVYPQQGKNKTTIDEQDIPRLDEEEFLNDNLIHFYFNFLEQRLLGHSPETAARILFMNSFFYLRLTSGVPGRSGINYEAVERWTAKVNIFEYDYIVIPVNEAAHWYLAIICNTPRLIEPPLQAEAESKAKEEQPKTGPVAHLPGDKRSEPEVDTKLEEMSLNDANEQPNGAGIEIESVQPASPSTGPAISEDANLKGLEVQSIDLTQPPKPKQGKKVGRKSFPQRKIDTSKPRIITLDSLGGSHSSTCTNLKRWLIAEAMSKRNFTIVDTGPFGMTAKGLPQQPNYCDCGVYLLMYLEKFLDDPDAFAAGILGDKHREDPIALPNASDKRNEIRDLLLYLQKHPKASIEDLMAVTSKHSGPPIHKREPTVLELEHGTQSELKGFVELGSHSSATPRDSKRKPVEQVKTHERKRHSSLPDALQSTAIHTQTTGREAQAVDVEQTSMAEQTETMFNRFKSTIAGLTGLSGRSSDRQAEPVNDDETLDGTLSNTEVIGRSRPRNVRSVETPGSPQQSTTFKQHDLVGPTQSDRIDLRSPSPKDRGYITSDVVRSIEMQSEEIPAVRLASPNSSNTNTAENGDEGETHFDHRSSNSEVMEIDDSQEENDAEMLLRSTESMDGTQVATQDAQDNDPGFLSDESSHPDPSVPETNCSEKTTSAATPHEISKSEPEKEAAESPPKTRKRKAEAALHESKQPGLGQQSVASPSKSRKRRSSEHDGAQSVTRNSSGHIGDPSDQEIIGRHGASKSKHIRWGEDGKQILVLEGSS